MRLKLIGYFLAMFSVAILSAPPRVQAYIADPMFGLDWRPSYCEYGTPGEDFCLLIYQYMVSQHNYSVDAAASRCGGNVYSECGIPIYIAYMSQFMNNSCQFNEAPSDELASWCITLYQKYIHDITGTGGGNY